MFLVATDGPKVVAALNKFASRLARIVPVGPVLTHRVGAYTLGWFGAKPSDNLHLFGDGVVVGRLAFDEPPGVTRSEESAPREVHPLLPSTLITFDGTVRPFNITNVYVRGDSASDAQLLLADLHGLGPSPEGVALLSSVGYFPGNTTLFGGVTRIPLLHAYDLGAGKSAPVAAFPPPAGDDDAMLARLIDIVPRSVHNHVGLTGGYDSRFVLGILSAAGAPTSVVSFGGTEREHVADIAAALSLPVTQVPAGSTARLGAGDYALLCDAQVAYSPRRFSQLREHLRPGSVYHTGHFGDSVIKNAFKTAWKVPGRRPIFERLIDHALLSRTPETVGGLCSFNERRALRAYLAERLSFERGYYPFATRKQWANWFYYVNRGVRWAQGFIADLGYFTTPVFILSDLQATSMGMATSAWSNFNNERARALSKRLLPAVEAPYFNGQAAAPPSALVRELRKVKYEYGDRLLARYKLRRRWARRSPDLPRDRESEGLRHYYDRPLPTLLADKAVGLSVKSAALTVNAVVGYLSSESL